MVEDNFQQKQKVHGEPIFKHYCRVCKRGFGCAGALGGHMRSHGVGDVRWNQPSSSHGQEFGISNFRSRAEGESTKHSYFLRTNTNRFTSYHRASDQDVRDNKRPFTRPGIDQRGKYASPMSSSESEVEEVNVIIESTRAKPDNYEDQHSASSEEEDLANCLVMLSNRSFVLSDKLEEEKSNPADKGLFQCKACKKVFNSHQALGGHRASHKKVKGCYASRFNDDETIEEDAINQHSDNLGQSENSSEHAGIIDLDFSPNRHDHHQLPNTNTLPNRKSKAHQCSICQRVFSSGQALGGHKRCHWLTSNLPDNTIIQNLQEFNFDSQQLYKKPAKITPSEPAPALDLNFPPLLNNAVDNLNMSSYSSTDAFNYEAPARMFLQLWGNEEGNKKRDHQHQRQRQHPHHHQHNAKKAVHDLNNSEEDDCRMKKIAKLSDMKDLDGGSSRWLQVGIASTTHIAAIP